MERHLLKVRRYSAVVPGLGENLERPVKTASGQGPSYDACASTKHHMFLRRHGKRNVLVPAKSKDVEKSGGQMPFRSDMVDAAHPVAPNPMPSGCVTQPQAKVAPLRTAPSRFYLLTVDLHASWLTREEKPLNQPKYKQKPIAAWHAPHAALVKLHSRLTRSRLTHQ